MLGKKMCGFVTLIMFCVCGLFPATVQAAGFKVLVVMSYEDDFPWVTEIREGINSMLSDTCEVRYFYMNTKRDIKGGDQKAKEAFALYQEFQPDGIITGDDNAQSMFVVPYLKDKVKTPVMFCGVNAKPEKYNYASPGKYEPLSNVSGILERYHVSESIAFVQQIVPTVKTFGYIIKDSPTGKAALNQIKSEVQTYPARFSDFRMPKTLKETIAMTKELKTSCDVIFTPTMQGIVGDDGKTLSDREALPIVAKTFGKPVIGGSAYNIKYGMLCGVIKTGQEQGRTAGKMLLKAMKGTPVSQIPITRNRNGKRIINVTMMKALKIRPNPVVLEGAELVRSEK